MLLLVGYNPTLFSRETDFSQETSIDLAEIKYLNKRRIQRRF